MDIADDDDGFASCEEETKEDSEHHKRRKSSSKKRNLEDDFTGDEIHDFYLEARNVKSEEALSTISFLIRGSDLLFRIHHGG